MDLEQTLTPAEGAQVTPEAPADTAADSQLTPEDQAAKAEDDEWDKVTGEVFPGLKSKQEKKADEQAQPDEKPEAGEAPAAGADAKKSDEKPGAGDAAAAKGDEDGGKSEDEEDADADGGPDVSAIGSRVTARQEAQRVESVKSDIREKLFADVPSELKDADGDPIKGVEDVQKLINPRTGQPFTEQEAGVWLLAAQSQLNQKLAETDKEVARVAEVNMDLKDQADMVLYNYGELLKVKPELGKEVWAEFEKTLVKDPKSGIITKAPISLERFYELALKPYVELAKKLEADAAAEAKAETDRKAAEEQAKLKVRQDRSDIYGGGKPDAGLSDEDKEWAEAANAVFGPLKR
jgi:hypothetical protein